MFSCRVDGQKVVSTGRFANVGCETQGHGVPDHQALPVSATQYLGFVRAHTIGGTVTERGPSGSVLPGPQFYTARPGSRWRRAPCGPCGPGRGACEAMLAGRWTRPAAIASISGHRPTPRHETALFLPQSRETQTDLDQQTYVTQKEMVTDGGCGARLSGTPPPPKKTAGQRLRPHEPHIASFLYISKLALHRVRASVLCFRH